jgi:small subunit ribosomal protein S6
VAPSRAYDLVVLIDADAPEDRRGSILEGIRNQIGSREGNVKNDVEWGVRKLAFEIKHKGDAYYHLFQFEVGGTDVLGELDHSLAIDDAVLRHRVINLPKGIPDSPPRPAPSAPRASAPAEESPAAAPAPSAEANGAPVAAEEQPEAAQTPSEPAGEETAQTPSEPSGEEAAQTPSEPGGEEPASG